MMRRRPTVRPRGTLSVLAALLVGLLPLAAPASVLQGYMQRAAIKAATSTTVNFSASADLTRRPIILAKDGRVAVLTAAPTAVTLSGGAGVKYIYADLAAPSGTAWGGTNGLVDNLALDVPWNRVELRAALRLLLAEDTALSYAAQTSTTVTLVMSTTAPASETTQYRLPIGAALWDGAAILSVISYGPSGDVSSVAEAPRSYLAGLALSNNATDAANDVDIAAGVARDSTNAATLSLGATLTKRLDAAWAVGTGAGGLDTGAEAASTWYHVWLIRRSDTGVVDGLFSLSATAPTMPTSYDQKRRIGAVFNDGSSNLKAFVQQGDRVRWTTSVADVSATNPGTAAVTRTLTVPTGVVVLAHVLAGVTWATTSGGKAYLSPLDATDEAVTNAVANIGGQGPGTDRVSGGEYRIKTNTSAQIRSRLSASGASDVLSIQTVGWVDTRGRDD